MVTYVVRGLLSAFAMMYTLVSLYACVPPPTAPATVPARDIPVSSAAQADAGIVNILQSRGEIGLALQRAVELYMSAHPGALINVHTVSPPDYRAALRTRLLAGGRADIFHIFSGQEAQELIAHLEDLSSLSWIGTAAEETAEPVSFGGGIYGVPYSLEAHGLIANRNIFEAAGISLMAVTDFEELSEAMAALAELIAGDGITREFPALRTVTDFAVQDRAYLSRIASAIPFTGEFASPADAITARELSFPQGAEAEELFRLLRRHSPRGDWTQRDGLTYLSQLEDFAAGRIAVLLCDMEGMRRILEINPELEGRVELMPIPLPHADSGRGKIYTGTPLWWSVNSASSDATKQNAKDFLTWLYQSEQGSTIIAARFGAVSPFRDTAKETGISVHRQMLSLANRGHSEPQTWREFPHDWGRDVFVGNFRGWYAGEQTWDAMLANLREEWAFSRLDYSNSS
jgi:raffinose/stachyose/melibiose transport system substrate-binding protein